MPQAIMAILAGCTLLTALAHAQPTAVQYLSGTGKDQRVDWEFRVNGGRNANQWSRIPVPSNWEMEGFGTYRYYDDWSTDPAPDSTGEYRHRFTVPAAWQGRKIEIVFGGAMTDTHVRINGQPAGPVHRGGFYEFRHDVSALVRPGRDNLLEVTVQRYSADPAVNRAERQADYWLFSGIYRPVWLEARPMVSIDRVALDARHDGQFGAEVEVAGGTGIVTATLTTMAGKPVGRPLLAAVTGGRATLAGRFAGIRPWSAEDPQRYRLELAYLEKNRPVHEVTRTVGFRTVQLRPRDGLYVNGARVRLKGSNRHSIWPDSGRTTSAALSAADARLMKDMNMNAVRMSHYPPDPHFLDAADELGLYVIDELAGWQKSYSTAAGRPLVKETVQRDQHHPSVILWANGNEGGFNLELDDEFARWDMQRRPVIHPWANFGGIDTMHYPAYGCCAASLFQGRDVFMPTEFLHGLYDGGAGAGLDDWWNAMLRHPLSAGGFIWAFADEGIVRADRGGAIDTAGNNAPDGILGPYREKEGSFYAIRQIWSPVYLPLAELAHLPATFDGRMAVENRYDHSSLRNVALRWKLARFGSGPGHEVTARGTARLPDIGPGLRGHVNLGLPRDRAGSDALYVTAVDAHGREIHTWSWMLASADSVARRMHDGRGQEAGTVELDDSGDAYRLRAGEVAVAIDKASGMLGELRKGDTVVPLARGPRLVHGSATLTAIRAERQGTDVVVQATYSGNLRQVGWRLAPSGKLTVNYAYGIENGKQADALGVTFDFPEAQVRAMRWLGRGPYRVWKNRTQGVGFDVWEKRYNDGITGQSWQYPEFKGLHDKVYWARFATDAGALTFVSHSDDLALRVFTPRDPAGEGADPKDTRVAWPPGDISFLDTLIPIGTKFRPAADTGPSGQRNRTPNLGFFAAHTIDILVGE
ncbi:glycoside hydrolase family 2 TIM barrel-domain containing protein [Massilia sp. METH4]|uniref:glycoside hydrolase family 2 TIM barrel-domain containing protein n=1 Tax=Massilia sp. METH4 TaxID=3123041 RepID=UPI0030CD729E